MVNSRVDSWPSFVYIVFRVMSFCLSTFFISYNLGIGFKVLNQIRGILIKKVLSTRLSCIRREKTISTLFANICGIPSCIY